MNPIESHPTRFRLWQSFLCLSAILLLGGLSSLPETQAQENADPTQAGAEMEEVIRALRAMEEEKTAPASSATVEERINLAGLVVGQEGEGRGGSAIFKVGESYLLAREGQALRSGSRSFVVESVTASLVLLKESGGEELVLRAQEPSTNQKPGEIALVEFQNVPLHLASRALSDETGLRIAPSTEARETPIDLYLKNVNPKEALDALVLTHRLYMSVVPDAEILRLHTTEEFARDAGSFSEELTRVFDLKYPNARDVALSIRDLFGDRVRLASRFEDEDEPGEYMTEDLQQRMERFDVIDARGQGFGVDSSNQGNRSLTSRLQSNRNSQNSRSFRNLDRLNRGNDFEVDRLTFEDGLTPEEIAALQAGDREVTERVLRQRADIYVTVIDRLNKVMVRTRDDKTMEEIAHLVDCLDVPTPLVLIEVKILEVDLERGLDTAFDWNFNPGTWNTSFNTNGPADPGDLVFNFLDNTFQNQIELLQQGNKLTVLGKPLLLTANNEVSRLFIGEEVPLNRNFNSGQPIAGGGGVVIPGVANTDIEFRPVGSTLLITPNINDDRTVSLRVLQEESRVVENGADVLVPDAGGGFVNTTIDTVASQTASGTFVAKDRETIAVGGMITERLVSQRSQIPILGDIPGIGLIARNQALGRQRTEIVLLLTPHIIKTPEEGERISRDLVQKNSFHPNAPDGEGQLNSFVRPNVLTTGSEEYGPLRQIQQRQMIRARPVHLEDELPLEEKKSLFNWRKKKKQP